MKRLQSTFANFNVRTQTNISTLNFQHRKLCVAFCRWTKQKIEWQMRLDRHMNRFLSTQTASAHFSTLIDSSHKCLPSNVGSWMKFSSPFDVCLFCGVHEMLAGKSRWLWTEYFSVKFDGIRAYLKNTLQILVRNEILKRILLTLAVVERFYWVVYF